MAQKAAKRMYRRKELTVDPTKKTNAPDRKKQKREHAQLESAITGKGGAKETAQLRKEGTREKVLEKMKGRKEKRKESAILGKSAKGMTQYVLVVIFT